MAHDLIGVLTEAVEQAVEKATGGRTGVADQGNAPQFTRPTATKDAAPAPGDTTPATNTGGVFRLDISRLDGPDVLG
ncbi:MAG TPA: hypothetical protein VGL77_13705 [Armatimonadota bacterium]|jgi:hypothetical protein